MEYNEEIYSLIITSCPIINYRKSLTFNVLMLLLKHIIITFLSNLIHFGRFWSNLVQFSQFWYSYLKIWKKRRRQICFESSHSKFEFVQKYISLVLLKTRYQFNKHTQKANSTKDRHIDSPQGTPKFVLQRVIELHISHQSKNLTSLERIRMPNCRKSKKFFESIDDRQYQRMPIY